MNLLLWRHAEAEDGNPDLARPLTAKGRAQASQVGHWLNKRLATEPRIYSSPAVRTRETAGALGAPFTVLPELAPGASAEEVLDALGLPLRSERSAIIVVVGHQPWIGETAALLVTGKVLSWSVRKAAVWWLQERTRGGAAAWLVKAVIDPDLI
jgi:phosphohistidine phosphatase